jgi:serine/threonine-protein kinase RsbW
VAGEDHAGVSHEAEIVREARKENLGDLLLFVQSACAHAALPADVAVAVRLAAEEACTNVIMHGYPNATPGPVAVHFASDDQRVVVTVEDQGAPFDPTRVSAPVLNAPVEARPLGGLGWHLIRAMMDEVTHQHTSERGNRLTLVKHLPTKAE